MTGDEACDPFGFVPDDKEARGLNAAMLCDTPSARMNCSRNSILVRPLANFVYGGRGGGGFAVLKVCWQV